MQAAVQEATTVLEAAGDAFKGPSRTTAPTEDAATLIRSLADKLKADAAKIGVMLGDGPVEASEASPLLMTLAQSGAVLCTQLHALTYQAGPSLAQELKGGATAVVKGSTALIQAVAAGTSPLQGGGVKHAVAQVWDACEHVKKQALDNKTALFRQLAAAIRAGKDALREMTELQQQNSAVREPDEAGEDEVQSKTANGHTNGAAAHGNSPAGVATAGAEAEEAVADVDFEGEPLSAAEQQVLSASTCLMQLAVTVLQQLAKTLLPADELPPAAVEGWESAAWHVKTLQRGLEDLGAAMYGPQEGEEVSSAADAITISLECMLDELPEEGPQLDGQQLHELQAQLELYQSRLNTAIATLPQAEDGGDHDDDDGHHEEEEA